MNAKKAAVIEIYKVRHVLLRSIHGIIAAEGFRYLVTALLMYHESDSYRVLTVHKCLPEDTLVSLLNLHPTKQKEAPFHTHRNKLALIVDGLDKDRPEVKCGAQFTAMLLDAITND